MFKKIKFFIIAALLAGATLPFDEIAFWWNL